MTYNDFTFFGTKKNPTTIKNIKMYLYYLSLLFFASVSEKVTLPIIKIIFKST